MAQLTFRVLTSLLVAAFLLNISNYFFMRFTRPLLRNDLIYHYPKTASGMEVPRVFLENQESISSSLHSEIYSKTDSTSTTEKQLEFCPDLPSLGEGNSTEILKSGDNPLIAHVKQGGKYQPISCKSQQSVAILIAFKGPKNVLSTLLNTLHTLLVRQQTHYQIFVVVQSNMSTPFNRGKLLNVGFRVTKCISTWRCIIFHDANIIPLDVRNIYRCTWYPKQLATTITNPNQPDKKPYAPLFGGVVAMTPEQFIKVNGFSNMYWASPGDYTNLHKRITSSGYLIANNIPVVGAYRKTLTAKNMWNKNASITNSTSHITDGLTSLSFRVESIKLMRLFTLVTVSIDPQINSVRCRFWKRCKCLSIKMIKA